MLNRKKHLPSLTRRDFLKLSSTLVIGTSLHPFITFSKSTQLLPLQPIRRAAFTMGSIATITAYCNDEARCNLAIDEAFREMKEIDKLMSVFNENSQLSMVNRFAAEQDIPVDVRIIEVLDQAKKIHAVTHGAFDATIEPLMKLYGFRDEISPKPFPSDRQIAESLDAIGMDKAVISNKKSEISFTHPKTKLDFGGIAVGYAIDRAANILKSVGIESALINHCGDICAIGTPPEDDNWEIGITDPMNIDNVITTVRIKNQALSTSGNYENFIKADGQTIGHLFNPISGKPASSILSGTTIANTAVEVDALSTGFFVLGIEKTKKIIQCSQHLQFIAVIQQGSEEEIVRISS